MFQIKVISRNHNDFLARYFGIKKTRELIAQNYYWPMLKADVEMYVQEYNMYLALKLKKHKLYSNLQFLLVLMH